MAVVAAAAAWDSLAGQTENSAVELQRICNSV